MQCVLASLTVKNLCKQRSRFVISRFQNRNIIQLERPSSTYQFTTNDPLPDLRSKIPDYDFIIAGGGLVGTILAVALVKTKRLENKRVLVLETANKTFSKEPWIRETDNEEFNDFSNRVFAISPGSRSILEKFGIWQHVWRFQDVTSLQVWDGMSDANISFNNPDFTAPVSCIVESPVLTYAISKVLEEHQQNIQIEYGSFVKTCNIPTVSNDSEPATVELKDGRSFSTKLLIGADGYGSRVRTAINSQYVSFDYDRTAVVATLQLTEPTENNVAWQRFLPTGGPIALLPLSKSFSSLVWSTTNNKAKELMGMSSDEFVDAVNSAFWETHPRSIVVQRASDLLSSIGMSTKGANMLPPSVGEVQEGSRATFPLGFGHSSYYVNRRCVLIGDAAHRIHPLAGQGLNLGIGDIDTLQRLVDKSVGLGADYGFLSVLQEYETERQRQNLAIQTGVDLLHRLYSTQFPPVVALRTLGLSFVNSSDMLKKFIMSQAAA